MARIATITINPAIDLETTVERVVPVHKLRCTGARRDPGGGGINVARVIRRLGTPVTAIYTIGGSIGRLLQSLVEREQIDSVTLPVSGETREDFTVDEVATGQQFRFVLAGPELGEAEWRACLKAVEALDPFPEYLVASGSLPSGVPDDFYGQVAVLAMARHAKLILDTSGTPLAQALTRRVFLVKPNLNEFRVLSGCRSENEDDLGKACQRLIKDSDVKVVALSLGHRGALFATADRAWRTPALPIKPISAVGAGDSFVGGLTWSLANGQTLEEAFRYGIAAATASLLAPGTQLCRPEDVHRLHDDVKLRAMD